MSKALIAGINQVATDKGLEREVIFNAIEAALVSAYKRNYGSVANVTAEIDRISGEMKVFAEREVVDDVINQNTEIRLEDAKVVNADVKLGDVISVESAPKDFGRIAAQTAKQVILQRIREAERDTVYENFVHKVGEIINAQVRSIDTTSGTVTVLLGEKHESLLPREEQIPSETLRRGDYVRLYVVDVHKSNRGPVIKLSRTHRNLLRRLMEQEIPEVRDGTVEIKSISREPGARSKVSVTTSVPAVDPVGSCVGMRGLRIQNIVNELAGEKIDVVEWSTDLRTYIANALSPAKVQSVLLDEESTVKTAVVVVPDRQLSLAIGKEGQNARLAAKLTGWRIDIKSESEAREEGLDLLAVHQTQRQTSGGGRDLLSLAERILQGDNTAESISEERLRQAAETIQRLDAEREHEDVAEEMASWPDSFKDLDDALRDRDESRAALDAFERAAAAIGTGDNLKPLFDEDDVDVVEDEPAEQEPVAPKETVARHVEPAFPDIVEEATEEEDQTAEETDVVEGEELPEIITADMLRQRMAQRRGQQVDFGPLDEIEVPEELLVGIGDEEEEEFEEWDGKRKGKRGVKPVAGKAVEKKKGKTAKRGKRREFEEEDFDDFSFR
ncbi:transcription termination/antitermination protein NusA [bacterium]|nr:transcription termination/antitermination protein NusA [bacterium]